MGGQTTRDIREQVRFYLLDHRTPLGRVIDISLLGLNLVFVGVFVAQSYPTSPPTAAWLRGFEVGIAAVFLVEYALRLYGAEDRFDEFSDPFTMVDLLAVLPTIAVLVLPVPAVTLNAGFLRMLRVIRVLRFYRFTRDEEFFFGDVSVETLRVMKLMLTVFVVFFVSAGLFYSAESPVNPGVATFGDAFYYVVITLTTVGFGDIVPATRAAAGSRSGACSPPSSSCRGRPGRSSANGSTATRST